MGGTSYDIGFFQVDHCKDPDDESLVVVKLASGRGRSLILDDIQSNSTKIPKESPTNHH